MSAWTEVSGKITISKHSKFSLRTYIECHFNEHVIRYINQTNNSQTILLDVNFVFEDSNLSASTEIQFLVDTIKRADKHAFVDLEANIRFLG